MIQYSSRINRFTRRPYLVKEVEIEYGEQLDDAKKIVDFFNKQFDLNNRAEEYLYLLTLDTKMRVNGLFLLSKGCDTETIVGMREIFNNALLVKAASIIHVHNHPSGYTKPSEADIEIALRTKSVADIIGMNFLDSIIIAADDYYSIRENYPEIFEKKLKYSQLLRALK